MCQVLRLNLDLTAIHLKKNVLHVNRPQAQEVQGFPREACCRKKENHPKCKAMFPMSLE